MSKYNVIGYDSNPHLSLSTFNGDNWKPPVNTVESFTIFKKPQKETSPLANISVVLGNKEVPCPSNVIKSCDYKNPFVCTSGEMQTYCAEDPLYFDHSSKCTQYCNTFALPTTGKQPRL